MHMHVVLPSTLGGSMGAILSGAFCPSSISLMASSMVMFSCIISPFMARSAILSIVHNIIPVMIVMFTKV